ncbi:hypothetical protein [Priestia aryabhattai]|uniref:hypothetical protein n=1 Tax=Priestia aryabhattai TaxID=412384 RepID=UPI002E24CE3A|nr:hypothetical protein [Priestia aryabhattai]
MLKGIALTIVLMMLCSFYANTTFANQVSHAEGLEAVIKEKLLQDGNDIKSSVKVELIRLDKVPQKNYYTALFSFKAHSSTYLGEASFIKENDEYEYAGGHGYGVNRINQTTITLDNQLYSVIYGENFNKRISSISARFPNKTFKYNINWIDSPYFVHFQKLPTTNMKEVYPSKITCYDQKHHKLTWHQCARVK